MDGVPKELDLPTFQRVMADGEKLERIGSFRKAITAYTTVRAHVRGALTCRRWRP